MRVEALILDMDGVLADTEPLHIRAWERAMEEVAPSVVRGAESLDAFHVEREKLTGMSSAEIAQRLIAFYRLDLPAETLLSRKRGIYRDMIAGNLTPFPGLPAELERWRGTPLALATSSTAKEALFALELLGLAGLFKSIVTSDDVRRAKPAPDCYLLAARLLGKAPADCWVIEDSAHGLRAAVDSGARVLAVESAEYSGAAGGTDRFPDGIAGRFSSTVEALQWLRG